MNSRNVALLSILVVATLVQSSCRQRDVHDSELPSVPPPLSPFKADTLNWEPKPRTLDEALVTLERGVSSDTRAMMRSWAEDKTNDLHFGLGRWIRDNWLLGPLYQDLRKLGLQHGDDMSAVILTSFWRRLHHEPLRVEEQVRQHLEFDRLQAAKSLRLRVK